LVVRDAGEDLIQPEKGSLHVSQGNDLDPSNLGALQDRTSFGETSDTPRWHSKSITRRFPASANRSFRKTQDVQRTIIMYIYTLTLITIYINGKMWREELGRWISCEADLGRDETGNGG
jgi:hypothetical protein